MNDLKISTQLKIGFTTLLLFVIILGIAAYLQTNQLQKQTEEIYNHPMSVKNAINDIQKDILSMRLGTRDLLLAKNAQENQDALQLMEIAKANVLQGFNVLYQLYLGPKADIDNAYNAFISWETNRQENTRLALSGEIDKVKESVLSTGNVGLLRSDMLAKIKIIDDFASKKAIDLFQNSKKLNDSLNIQLFLIIAIILFLSLIINFTLMRNIRKPLEELTDVTHRFHRGDMNARSTYTSENEFGILSSSFNSLAESIQLNWELNERETNLTSLMLGEVDARKFFRATITALAEHTGAQMAAVYLLRSDKKTFEHFESIGLDNKAKQAFAVDSFEGEFGASLSEKKIIHITQIPEETIFSFPVVSGRFRPRDIITIPILEFGEVVAVVSLASLKEFSGISIQLINEIWVLLTTRINGVLAFKKIIDFSDKLDLQNKELEHQSKELTMQASELKEYNIELELQKKQLDEANKLKSAFLSNMSHELRTPLNSVIALSGVLNRKLKNQISADEYNYLGIIEKNGKQLLSLINDILDLSRIEAGKEEISFTKFTIQNQVKNIIETILPIAEEKGITLINYIPESLSPIVCDSSMSHHILQNVISNAVKFTEKGTVEITAEITNGKLYVGVKDTGIGISKEELPFIFDEFRQADGKTSRKFGGTGLGLAIAKKYIQLLNGTIEVQSMDGTGSTFVVMIPVKPFHHEFTDSEFDFIEQGRQNYTSTPVKTQSGKNLLLVEDSEPQIIQLTDILQEEGYIIHVARSGKEALEAIQISIPDAIVLDLMMPEVDGFEVLKSIRSQEKTAQLPVLILSAKHITKQELSFLKGNHIYQLIQKGDVNRNELLTYIHNMIVSVEPENVNDEKRRLSGKTINRRANILLIEDNQDNITTIKALVGESYEIFTAMDGLSGIEKAKTHKPDLILLDLHLPDMDGQTILKEIKKDSDLSNIPVVVITARAMKGDREELLSLGFDDYITKPIDHDSFEKTIQACIIDNNKI